MNHLKIVVALIFLFCIMCASDYIPMLSYFRAIYRQLIFIIIPGLIYAYILGYMRVNVCITSLIPPTYIVLFLYISQQIEGNFAKKSDVIDACIARFFFFLFVCCVLAFIGWRHKCFVDKKYIIRD